MSEAFSVTNLTQGKPPRLPFARIKESILGKKYIMSLVFAGDARMKRLNQIYRKKNTVPNVLSFPINKKEGEIFINLKKAAKDADKYKKSYNKFVGFLFVHAILHLKGCEHGIEMEKEEEKICRKFNL